MTHPTMLDDVGPTCWLRLNRPLHYGPGIVTLESSTLTFTANVKPLTKLLVLQLYYNSF